MVGHGGRSSAGSYLANPTSPIASHCAVIICLVQVRLGTEVLRTPSSTRPGFDSRPPDHDRTLYVTETPSLTTRPSVTFLFKSVPVHQLSVTRTLRGKTFEFIFNRKQHLSLGEVFFPCRQKNKTVTTMAHCRRFSQQNFFICLAVNENIGIPAALECCSLLNVFSAFF